MTKAPGSDVKDATLGEGGGIRGRASVAGVRLRSIDEIESGRLAQCGRVMVGLKKERAKTVDVGGIMDEYTCCRY